MGRKKTNNFKLNPEWMLKRPLDFEYNKYVLLDYIQKCEKGFDNLEIYPDFIEISLHLANIQSLYKSKKVLFTEKTSDAYDDDFLLKDLIKKDIKKLSQEEEVELGKTLMYSVDKLMEAFNIAKSIWNVAFDNIEIAIRKNKNNISFGMGYCFYYKKDDDILYVWEFEFEENKDSGLNKCNINLIYKEIPSELSLMTIIEEKTTFNDFDFFSELPIFEVKSTQYFPMDKTFVPIMKRKVMTYMYQLGFSKPTKVIEI
jgi:hypothetical protein